jgi:cytosine/adenosine deaminase-related metal-dependent hydrolase
MAAFGQGPTERLARLGLLDDRALLAHGIDLEDREYRMAAEAGATLIHNPESNANNGVGRLDVPRVRELGCRIGLGTDGMSSAMLRSLRFAFMHARGVEEDPTVGFQALPHLLAANAEVAGRFLDEPLLGELTPGGPADIIVVNSAPPTPLTEDNLFGHLVFGASEAPVRHTVARGKVLLENYRHTTLNPGEIAREARGVAPRLWERFHALDWNTPYLGPGSPDRP